MPPRQSATLLSTRTGVSHTNGKLDVTLACEDANSNLLRLLLLLMLMMRNVLVVVMKFNLGCKFTFC